MHQTGDNAFWPNAQKGRLVMSRPFILFPVVELWLGHNFYIIFYSSF